MDARAQFPITIDLHPAHCNIALGQDWALAPLPTQVGFDEAPLKRALSEMALFRLSVDMAHPGGSWQRPREMVRNGVRGERRRRILCPMSVSLTISGSSMQRLGNARSRFREAQCKPRNSAAMHL